MLPTDRNRPMQAGMTASTKARTGTALEREPRHRILEIVAQLGLTLRAHFLCREGGSSKQRRGNWGIRVKTLNGPPRTIGKEI